MDRLSVSFVQARVLAGISHADIASELQALFPGVRGFSATSVYRYCRDHDIHYRSRLSDREVDAVVEDVVDQVAHY